MEPENDGFQVQNLQTSRDFFSGSMLNFRGIEHSTASYPVLGYVLEKWMTPEDVFLMPTLMGRDRVFLKHAQKTDPIKAVELIGS